MGACFKWLLGAVWITTIGCNPKLEHSRFNSLDSADTGIFGGSRVEENDPLAKALFKLVIENGAETTTCSAARISDRLLLTAAHCAKFEKIWIFTASGNYFGLVTNKRIHPKYEQRANEIKSKKLWHLANEYDVAILEIVSEQAQQSEKVFFKLNRNIKHLQKVSVAGFGYENYDSLAGSRQGDTTLKWTHLEKKPSVQNEITVFDQKTGHGICLGDSGGVAFLNSENRVELLGIAISVQNPQSRESCKGLSRFINIDSIYQWLLGNILFNRY